MAVTPDPPLVSLTVTNPVTYIKKWWRRVMYGEGIDIRFRIHPVTACALAFIFAFGGFGLARITLPASNPIVKYIPQLLPTPTPNPYRDTAFSGILKLSTPNNYYLVTTQAEAITLTVPSNIDLKKYVDKRIFATGKYNTLTNTLIVAHAQDLELLPLKPSPIPTIHLSPTPTILP